MQDLHIDRGYYPSQIRDGLLESKNLKVYPKIDFPNCQSFQLKPEQKFAATLYGYLYIPVSGKVKFHLESDDGSRLFINQDAMVYNDGDHAMQTKSKERYFNKGYHFFEIQYYNKQATGGLKFTGACLGKGK